MIAYRETSREAWASHRPEILDDQIRACLLSNPEGMTCEGIEEHIGRSHQAVSGNLRHLVERRLVTATGNFGKTRTGRRANIWAATTLGLGKTTWGNGKGRQ